MEERYLTITGFRNYYGTTPFAVGRLINCQKEPGNRFDSEAIRCSLPAIGTVGYVANSPHTAAVGTMSAGRLYDRVPRRFYARVMFITQSKVICRVEEATAHRNDELERQRREMEEDWYDDDCLDCPCRRCGRE